MIGRADPSDRVPHVDRQDTTNDVEISSPVTSKDQDVTEVENHTNGTHGSVNGNTIPNNYESSIDESKRNGNTIENTNTAANRNGATNDNDSEVLSDDEYLVSDDDELNAFLASDSIHYPNSLSEHAAYLSNTLSHALDSLELDKSLVLQAQISGKLNNQNQMLVEKNAELGARLKRLRQLYNDNFVVRQDLALKVKLSKVDQMKNDLAAIEQRIARLKMGENKSSYLPFLRSTHHTQIGVAKKYPIEYNQAKTKVLERQIEDL